ncbi:MAG TPA: UDP-N-acetylmuramyl-tripeptide synthetase [Candidatus Dojkabacteria bacterium]|nr:UDP-N-acetylmuramyl-tripeptide synthetase [Candidatus Dojkabacteria bacterium]
MNKIGNYEKLKEVRCLGIGGAGLFYIAKFLLLCGTKVYGHDISPNPRTDELIKMGAKITFANPEKPFDKNTDAYIFSAALPDDIIQKLHKDNPDIKAMEVGEMYDQLIKDYEGKNLSDKEIKAFEDSDIAPLFKIDFEKMKYIGVTGTDGKTTTSTMIYHTLLKLGYKPGLISTVSAKIGDKEIDTGFHTTTPSSQELFKLIKTMEQEGCSHAIIESTSHGLAMGRLAGIKFDTVAYTNITNEHLDYHKTWENYALAKSRLITEHLKNGGKVILNYDDKKSYDFLTNIINNTGRKDIVKLSYSRLSDSKDIDKINYIALNNAGKKSEDGNISYTLVTRNDSIKSLDFKTDLVDSLINLIPVEMQILGEYNISNSLAAIATIQQITDNSIAEIIQALSFFETIKGRMEVVQKAPFMVIVDFAHTPNALENALKSAKALLKDNNKLISVFGCAGKRDPSKRGPMGEISGTIADVTILTAEDPRSESLKAINDEIEVGFTKSLKTVNSSSSDETSLPHQLIRFDDDTQNVKVRRDALIKAFDIANNGDIVIICGKAHEQSLCFGNTEYPWNDIDEAKKLLKEK